MPLFRLLIIALIIVGIIYLYRRLSAGSSSTTKQTVQEHSTQAVKCELCGLHVPEHEAVRRGNHIYCCQDHANRAAQR